MEYNASEPISVLLVQLNDAVRLLRSKQETMDENTVAWQRRIEAKMDQQLNALGSGSPHRISLKHPSGPRSPRPYQSPNLMPPGAIDASSKVIPDKPVGFQAREEDATESQRPEGIDATKSLPLTSDAQKSLPLQESSSRFNREDSNDRKLLGKVTKSKTHHTLQAKKVNNFITSARRQEIINATTLLLRFTEDKRYEMGVMFVILLNSVFIGWQVQVVAYRVEDSFKSGSTYNAHPPVGFVVLQSIFSIILLFELALRWYAEGLLEFFVSPDLPWNLFDIFTVVAGIIELILEFVEPDSAVVASISVIRLLRILRIVRLLKVIRSYPWFHELRLMFESCLNSFKSYMWSILILLLLIYLFAIFLTTGTCLLLADEEKYLANNDIQFTVLQNFFGTVDKSMLSLFQTIAGGRDWYEFYDALGPLGASRKLVYLIYISFATYAVCNVVAAVFVESAMQSASTDRETLIRDTLRDAQVYQQKMMNVFNEMDTDGTGTISEQEFLAHLDDARVVAYFDSMKLDVSDATSLFKLLDVDHSGSVEFMEFIEGCQKLKGTSRTLDLHLMRYELHSMRFELHDLALKFYKYAEMKGVERLGDRSLAEHEHLESPVDLEAVRKVASARKLRGLAEVRSLGSRGSWDTQSSEVRRAAFQVLTGE